MKNKEGIPRSRTFTMCRQWVSTWGTFAVGYNPVRSSAIFQSLFWTALSWVSAVDSTGLMFSK